MKFLGLHGWIKMGAHYALAPRERRDRTMKKVHRVAKVKLFFDSVAALPRVGPRPRAAA